MCLALGAGCTTAEPDGASSGGPPTSPPLDESSTTTAVTTTPAPPAATVLAAGDIAGCETQGDERTAALLDAHEGTILTLGDNVYERGTAREFADCYAPTWGRHLGRTRPAPGNHDYGNGRATAYFDYFGPSAGERGKGWYSFDVGGWHLVALNSNCAIVGGCGRGSEQERWLRADLAAHPRRCTLAYWHHARFSSGLHGDNDVTDGLWRALQDAGADVVLTGHDHDYERFTTLDPAGRPAAQGIRVFVVGTGGRSLYPFRAPVPGSEVRHAAGYGILRLVLGEKGYDWRFLPVEGSSFSDTGEGTCR
ncbi:MAG TPA: metallophosphoesterase [Acidimicrobiales bacterium]|nr:metallophosphoesterase [Acidimicrobiales bacterium]